MSENEVNENIEQPTDLDMASLLLGDNFDENGELKAPTEDSSTSDQDAVEADAEDKTVEASDSEEKQEAEATDAEAGNEEEEQVVLAKDGKNTIPYEVLENHRKGEQDALKRVGELEAEMKRHQEVSERLDEAKAQDDKEGGDENVAELLSDLEEEHPEMIDGVKALIEQGRSEDKALIADLQEKIDAMNEKLAPIEQTAIKQDIAEHFGTIEEAHEDLDEIMAGLDKDDSPINKFLNSQPSFTKDLYDNIIEKGSAEQVIELLTTFKDATGYGKKEESGTDLNSDGKDAAKAAEAKAKSATPNSLSDIPAGSTHPVDEAEAMLQVKNPMALVNKFNNKSPEEIERLISKVI